MPWRSLASGQRGATSSGHCGASLAEILLSSLRGARYGLLGVHHASVLSLLTWGSITEKPVSSDLTCGIPLSRRSHASGYRGAELYHQSSIYTYTTWALRLHSASSEVLCLRVFMTWGLKLNITSKTGVFLHVLYVGLCKATN